MKKFVKVSLITAGIFFVIGMVLCLIGGIGGGRRLAREGFQKGVLDTWCRRIGDELYEEPETGIGNTRRTEAEIPLEGINSLKLFLGAGTFIIEEKEEADGLISLFIDGKADFHYRVEEDTLIMEGFRGWRLRNGEDNQVVVQVPRDAYFDEIQIEAGASASRIAGLWAEELAVSVGAGELFMQDTEADELSIDVGMGTAEIQLPGAKEEYNYELTCGMGTILLGEEEITALAAERKINHQADKEVALTCGMGELSLAFNSHKKSGS